MIQNVAGGILNYDNVTCDNNVKSHLKYFLLKWSITSRDRIFYIPSGALTCDVNPINFTLRGAATFCLGKYENATGFCAENIAACNQHPPPTALSEFRVVASL